MKDKCIDNNMQISKQRLSLMKKPSSVRLTPRLKMTSEYVFLRMEIVILDIGRID